jgi:hypothetical protein
MVKTRCWISIGMSNFCSEHYIALLESSECKSPALVTYDTCSRKMYLYTSSVKRLRSSTLSRRLLSVFRMLTRGVKGGKVNVESRVSSQILYWSLVRSSDIKVSDVTDVTLHSKQLVGGPGSESRLLRLLKISREMVGLQRLNLQVNSLVC